MFRIGRKREVKFNIKISRGEPSRLKIVSTLAKQKVVGYSTAIIQVSPLLFHVPTQNTPLVALARVLQLRGTLISSFRVTILRSQFLDPH